MCANPEMMRTLAAELREEFATRKAARGSAETPRRWPVAAGLLAVCAALFVIL